MPEPSESESDSARAAALRELLGVERWERLEPWAVARVRVRGADVAPSVVVKWAEGGPVQGRDAGWRLRTEVAALRFLRDDVGIGLAPRVIAADAAAGFVVLEDLAPRTALDRLLRSGGPRRPAGRLRPCPR
ncbi:hypothetical protein [Streptomyces sp. NPDC020480]|uniref:hypothetical protein n=1 Tax=Streptomyces sp. NPDC020480 TaxID=3365076 RepID=UPI0037AA3B61